MKKILMIAIISSLCFTQFRIGIDTFKELDVSFTDEMNGNFFLGYESFIKDSNMGYGLEYVIKTDSEYLPSFDFEIASLYGMYRFNSQDNREAFFKFGYSYLGLDYDENIASDIYSDFDFIANYDGSKVEGSFMIGFGTNFNKKYQVSYTLHTGKWDNGDYYSKHNLQISRFSLAMLF